MKRRALAFWSIPALLLFATCVAHAQEPQRILFVGNSYLYTNRLPDVVAALAADGHAGIDVEMLAKPDFALSDHLHELRLSRLLRERWDWIVLQQGPSNSPASRRELIQGVTRIARLAPSGARLALMSAWPQAKYADTSLAAEASYREAATATGACILPVATAWRLAATDASPPALYQGDQLHPTMAGTWLAAITILHGVVDMDPMGSAPWAMQAERVLGVPIARVEGWAQAAISQETRACRPTIRSVPVAAASSASAPSAAWVWR